MIVRLVNGVGRCVGDYDRDGSGEQEINYDLQVLALARVMPMRLGKYSEFIGNVVETINDAQNRKCGAMV